MKLNKVVNYNISGFAFKVPKEFQCSFKNCIFSSLTKATPISADSIESTIELEECFFDSINGDKEGACIHVNCSLLKTMISMNKVIGSECMSENLEGSFGHLNTKGDVDMKDIVISRCAPVKTAAHYATLACPKAIYQGGNMTDCLAFSDLLTFITEEQSPCHKVIFLDA